MKRPLVVLCMVFCSGIWFSVFAAAVSFAVFFILSTAFAVLSLSAIKHRWEFTICLCLTVFFLGAATMRNVQEAAPNHIIKQLPFISGPIQLKGVIANEPRVNKGRTEFLFYCRQLIFPDGRSKKVCGRVLVKASGSYNFKYGQLLLLKGKLLRPFNFPLSIRLGYRDYLARKQIYCLMSVGKTGEVRDLKENCGNPLLGFSFRFKEKIETVINQNLSPIPASVLNAMILGERKSVPQFLNEAMVKTGTVHILVVSGFNVGIVAF
ncbi:MAG: ComEC/Rec2 family competence protein, partial [Candidatus Omnitrophota bacterium]